MPGNTIKELQATISETRVKIDSLEAELNKAKGQDIDRADKRDLIDAMKKTLTVVTLNTPTHDAPNEENAKAIQLLNNLTKNAHEYIESRPTMVVLDYQGTERRSKYDPVPQLHEETWQSVSDTIDQLKTAAKHAENPAVTSMQAQMKNEVQSHAVNSQETNKAAPNKKNQNNTSS